MWRPIDDYEKSFMRSMLATAQGADLKTVPEAYEQHEDLWKNDHYKIKDGDEEQYYSRDGAQVYLNAIISDFFLNDYSNWMRWCGKFWREMPPNSLVLDYGCGSGLYVSVMAQKPDGCTYHAYDINPKATEFTKSLAARLDVVDRVTIVDKSVIDRTAYDAIICMDTLEHVSDPCEHLKYLWEHLKRDGLYFDNTSFGNEVSVEHIPSSDPRVLEFDNLLHVLFQRLPRRYQFPRLFKRKSDIETIAR